MLAAGFFFLWMAVSAFITGFLLLLIPVLSVEVQFFIFSVLSISSVIAWKRYMVNHPVKTDHPNLNQHSARYIGHTFTLVEAIEDGWGKIKINDSRWKVEGQDCPVGSRIRIIKVDGNFFKVEKVE
jgi:membrane protein implicated in regulation of membrane protease activity